MTATARQLRWALALGLLLLAACAAQKGTIGAVLGQQADGRLFVRDVPEGLAADKAGLEPGDEILLIDGRDVRALGSDGVHAALVGEVGEKVKLTVVRGEDVLRLTVERTPAKKWAMTRSAAPPER